MGRGWGLGQGQEVLMVRSDGGLAGGMGLSVFVELSSRYCPQGH